MNWTNVITDLLQRGHTFVSIGEAINVTPAAVRAMMKNIGQQPRWHTGNALIKLHSKVMRKYQRVDTKA